MKRDRAAYMREYRKRKKDPPEDWDKTPKGVAAVAAEHILRLGADRRDLEEEVRHLKAELAKRPTYPAQLKQPHLARYNTHPFTPVPKHK